MLQFADISGPCVTLQRPHRPLGESHARTAIALCGLLEKVRGETRNVLGSVAERRHNDRKDAQAIEQISTETAGCDILLQIPIGCRDHTDVHASRSVITHSFKAAIVSRRFDERAALYIETIWVHHSNVQPASAGEADDTLMIGLGGRVRVRPSISIAAEFSPRTAGYRPGVNHASVALEKRVGGHVFQLNFSDSFATTVGQIARGGPAAKDWFLGFNISRKFF